MAKHNPLKVTTGGGCALSDAEFIDAMDLTDSHLLLHPDGVFEIDGDGVTRQLMNQLIDAAVMTSMRGRGR